MCFWALTDAVENVPGIADLWFSPRFRHARFKSGSILARLRPMVNLPIVKVSISQGPLITEYLRLVGSHQISSVNQVRRAFRPIVFRDKLRRYVEAGTPEKYDEMTKNTKVSEKRFDSEYCRLIDFCEILDLVSHQDNEVMLSFFGRLLLREMQAQKCNDVFGPQVRDLFARMLVFVDSVDRWQILATLESLGGRASTRQLTEALIERGVSIDRKGVESRIRQKLREMHVREWKESGKRGLPDFYWMKKREQDDLEQRVVDEEERILVDLLRLFRHAGLVELKGDDALLESERLAQVKAMDFWNNSARVNEDEFRKAFLATLRKHSSARKPNVPLPIVRDEVCNKLSIPWQTFDHLVAKVKVSGTKEALSFSQGRFRKKWGLTLNKVPYYYVSIREATPRGGKT